MSKRRQIAREPSDDPTRIIRGIVALLMNVPTLLHYGGHEPVGSLLLLNIAHGSLLGVFILLLVGTHFINKKRRVGKKGRFMRVSRAEQVFAFIGLLFCWSMPAIAGVGVALTLLFMLRAYLVLVQSSIIPPGLVFVSSFILLISAGTGLLMLPAATPADQPINVTDAAFTITSAISQTGLTVRSTDLGFTRFGQIIIMIWIQVGALGIIVFGALLATVIGSGFGLKATKTMAEGTEQGWAGQLSLQRLVIFTIIVTHAFELVGAVTLYLAWPTTWLGAPTDFATEVDRMFHAAFFTVSAFCNAGFATTQNSLEGLRTHWTSHVVIVPLIILGSIGFPVLDNIFRSIVSRIRGRRVDAGGQLIRLSLNTKIILTTSLALYVAGFILIFIGEVTQAEQPGGYAVLDAHFMNMNRTSGFDTISPSEMGVLSRLTLIFLMFCGGAPGSVAGGIKLMVLAVLALTVWSTILGRERTEAFGRTLPDILVRKSATLIVLMLSLIMAISGIVAYYEPDHTLEEIVFEVVSAVCTCGFSVGIVDELNTPSRWAMSVGMFLGRVGPFAFFAALVGITRAGRAQYRYPTESVNVY